MIVTENTPRYEDHTVAEAGSLLPEADVVDEYSTGIKIDASYLDRTLVAVKFDTLSGRPQTAYLTPDEADHLAQLLIAHAKAARAW